MKNSETTPNYLKYWRTRRNLSLQKLSLQINGTNYASAATLMRWEKGTIKEWAIPVLAKALKISEHELLEGPSQEDKLPMVGTAIAYNGIDIEIAESIINLGYISWLASKPSEARKAIQTILPLLERSQKQGPVNKDEKFIMARAYELLGALALDRLDHEGAIIEFRRALALSEELGEINLIAAHMTQIGEAYRRKGKISAGLEIMETALNIARKHDKATLGYVLEMLAYTYSENNNKQAFRYHIEEAIDLLSFSGTGKGVSQREFVPFEVLEIYGKGLRDFGYPKEGLTYLQRAQDTLNMQTNIPRWQAVIAISKAQALCDTGEVEEGITLAIQGYQLAHYCQSPRQANRVVKLSRKLKEMPGIPENNITRLDETIRNFHHEGGRQIDAYHQHPM